MNHRLAVLAVFAGICIASFCIGQGKPAVKSQVASDVKISDHDRVEKLLVEVAELQKKLDDVTQRYNTHTHQLRNLRFAQLPGSIECNQTVVQWTPADINRGSVDKVCRQIMSGNIGVVVQGSESIATGLPHP